MMNQMNLNLEFKLEKNVENLILIQCFKTKNNYINIAKL